MLIITFNLLGQLYPSIRHHLKPVQTDGYHKNFFTRVLFHLLVHGFFSGL